MKRLAFILILCALLIAHAGGAVIAGPPFTDPKTVKSTEGKLYGPQRLVDLFQVGVNSFPYLLSVYLDTGDLLVLQQIHDTIEAVELYVQSMGKSIKNDRDKEVFAKLLASSQNLKENVERNLKAVETFRRLRQVFDQRSTLLIQWIDLQLAAQSSSNVAAAPEPDDAIRKAFRAIRIDLLKAAFYYRILPCSSVNDPRQEKAREVLQSAADKAKVLAGEAASAGEKEVVNWLETSLTNVGSLARDLVIHRDELDQAWEQTLTLVESLDALISATATDETSKEKTDEKKPAPEKSRQ